MADRPGGSLHGWQEEVLRVARPRGLSAAPQAFCRRRRHLSADRHAGNDRRGDGEDFAAPALQARRFRSSTSRTNCRISSITCCRCCARRGYARRPCHTSAGSSGGTAASKRARIGVARRGEHRLGRPALDDLAVMHHQHALAEIAHHREVVRDEQHRECRARAAGAAADRGSAPAPTRRGRTRSRRRPGASASRTSARAILTRWRCPPDSCAGKREAIRRQPDLAQQSPRARQRASPADSAAAASSACVTMPPRGGAD